jgi:hypothetical protein
MIIIVNALSQNENIIFKTGIKQHLIKYYYTVKQVFKFIGLILVIGLDIKHCAMKTKKNKLFRISIEKCLVGLALLISNISFSQNPCGSQTSITCGINYNYNLASGAGAWNPTSGPWGTPGREQIFSYTPSVSGAYSILVTNNNYYVDLFYKTGVCNQNGWIYVNDILTSEANTLTLTAGTTYYFLIDDENTTASSGIINVSCPCVPPPGGIDETIVIESNVVNSVSTTIGACNDCSYRPSTDRVLEIEIVCSGDYTFSLCGGATWDTYIYLSDLPCAGAVLAFNDDNCGLQSSITANLNIGTYYLAIEGYSSAAAGVYDVEVTTTCDFSILPVELVFFTGENSGRKNLLSWQTASELNNDYFVLERSTDGLVFSQIAVIEGKGTTQGINNYTHVDDNFSATTNYYRLKQVDFNGLTKAYDMIALLFQTDFDDGLSIFPNPSSGIFTVSLNKHLVAPVLTVFNGLGKSVLVQDLSIKDQLTINLNERPGIYFVSVTSESQTLTRKIIIQ